MPEQDYVDAAEIEALQESVADLRLEVKQKERERERAVKQGHRHTQVQSLRDEETRLRAQIEALDAQPAVGEEPEPVEFVPVDEAALAALDPDQTILRPETGPNVPDPTAEKLDARKESDR